MNQNPRASLNLELVRSPATLSGRWLIHMATITGTYLGMTPLPSPL